MRTVFFALIFCLPSLAMAQDLFLKKDGAAKSEEKKAAPLFLPSNPSGEKKAPAAKPLFLDQPSGNYAPGGLFNPVEKSGKILSLKKKKANELKPAERMELAMEETRLANLDNIRQESLRAQSRTASALAKWEADTAAEKARQAALAPAPLQPELLAEPQIAEEPKPAPRKPAPLKEEESNIPKPVFNTVH